MNIILDTHILLWWLSDDRKLSEEARQLISDIDNIIFISAATVWEMSIKKALGKLKAPDNFEEILIENDLEALPINLKHAELAGSLPNHHYDPFDRMLIAQAITENINLLTHDKTLLKYGEIAILV